MLITRGWEITTSPHVREIFPMDQYHYAHIEYLFIGYFITEKFQVLGANLLHYQHIP